MPVTTSLSTRDGAIWRRLFRTRGKALSLSAARELLGLDFAEKDKARMRELAEGARAGTLTESELDEIQSYERVGNILAVLKSQARQRLKQTS